MVLKTIVRITFEKPNTPGGRVVLVCKMSKKANDNKQAHLPSNEDFLKVVQFHASRAVIVVARSTVYQLLFEFRRSCLTETMRMKRKPTRNDEKNRLTRVHTRFTRKTPYGSER